MVAPMERSVTRLALIAVAALSLGSCGSKGPANSGARGTAVRIAVGGQNQLLYLPTTLARELGFYQDEGLAVDIQDFAGGSKALEALVGGSADVVSGFYDHTIQMAADGRELVAFVAMLRFPGLVLTTSPQRAGDLTRIEDLKGRIAGVTAAGSSTQMLLTYLLKKHGVDPDTVSVVSIGNAATAIAALEHGKVDAGMMADPAFTMMRKRNPSARILVDMRTVEGVKAAFGSDTYLASVIYAKGEWLRAHRETAAHVARAITRTLEWMQQHSAEEIAEKTPAAFRGDDQALYVAAVKSSMPMFSPDGRMSADGAEAVRQLLAASLDKIRDAKIDLSKTFTNEFINGR
jgi:NitT/TauT family transport system substrate-binding protein